MPQGMGVQIPPGAPFDVHDNRYVHASMNIGKIMNIDFKTEKCSIELLVALVAKLARRKGLKIPYLRNAVGSNPTQSTTSA